MDAKDQYRLWVQQYLNRPETVNQIKARARRELEIERLEYQWNLPEREDGLKAEEP